MNTLKHLVRPLAAAALIGAFFFAMSVALSAKDWPLADMNRTIDQTNFVVNEGCSGTLIEASAGYVLTANHCVTAQYEMIDRENVDDDGLVTHEKVRKLRDGTVSQLEFAGSESIRTVVYKVRLMAVDSDKDLALLQVRAKLPNVEAAKMACETPVRGSVAYVVGNPMGMLYSSVTKGIVSSMQRDYALIGVDTGEKEPLMQISSGVIGGNSGGAVYNEQGEFIGVPVRTSRVNEVLGFAAPLTAVREFLSRNKLSGLFARCAE